MKVVDVFNACFAHSNLAPPQRTFLIGGASEPIYLPSTASVDEHIYAASADDDAHTSEKISLTGVKTLSLLPQGNKVFFRHDYLASALHEVAHWCIAGEARRRQIDYGYWYAPDGRTHAQQKAFEQVEVKPQALEWAFSNACAIPFKISNDNLALANDISVDSTAFECAVENQLVKYMREGLPPRAKQFRERLLEHFA
ncbi:elongation factor P hydroxylase [Ningiella sp. W23]|uniref:elongation factor P hydroxylase n=1 Tax=Ningiella sp. W23 TaxID=3023715 RepID=UPI0037572D32